MSPTRTTGSVQGGSYRGGYWVSLVILVVVAMRTVLFFGEGQHLVTAVAIMATFSLLYLSQPLLAPRSPFFRLMYLPVQVGLLLTLASLRPFLDIISLLYINLSLQAVRTFSQRVAGAWMLLFAALFTLTLLIGLGFVEGFALALSYMAGGAILISYDLHYTQLANAQAQSQLLLEELRQAHEKLKLHADQAEELAAIQERNRLARELHDSVSQVIFSVTLTSQSARLLLERDPSRVPEQLDRLQEMTASALSQLRALIAQLRPSPR